MGTSFSSNMVTRFYTERRSQPAWITNTGISPQTAQLLLTLENSSSHGLFPDEYYIDEIRTRMTALNRQWQNGQGFTLKQLIDFELLCTHAYHKLATHLLDGRVIAQDIFPRFVPCTESINISRFLNYALQTHQLLQATEQLSPQALGYYRLKTALARYRKLAQSTTWDYLDEGPELRPGEVSPQITIIRKKLIALGDLETNQVPEDDQIFDNELREAVERFQKRHSLPESGYIGPMTRYHLNFPLEARIFQIIINMERWRWLPNKLEPDYLWVSIPDQTMDIVKNYKKHTSMAVIVGKPDRQTPLINQNITNILINPAWQVPQNIAIHDLLPRLKENPDLMEREQFQLYQWRNNQRIEIDADSVNWDQLSSTNFPYSLQQLPGDQNSLGKLVFQFPNNFDIYLHDTPLRHLFREPKRLLSSGCIRVEDPVAVGNFLLRNQPGWQPDQLIEKLNTPTGDTIRLLQGTPVHIVYFTVQALPDNRLDFKEDLYNLDETLIHEFE